jgi:hypothetical protein
MIRGGAAAGCWFLVSGFRIATIPEVAQEAPGRANRWSRHLRDHYFVRAREVGFFTKTEAPCALVSSLSQPRFRD